MKIEFVNFVLNDFKPFFSCLRANVSLSTFVINLIVLLSRVFLRCQVGVIYITAHTTLGFFVYLVVVTIGFSSFSTYKPNLVQVYCFYISGYIVLASLFNLWIFHDPVRKEKVIKFLSEDFVKKYVSNS